MVGVVTAAAAQAGCASFTAPPISVSYDPLGAQGSAQIVQPITLTAASDSGSPTAVMGQFVDQNSGSLRIGTGGPLYTIMRSYNRVVVPLGVTFNPSFAFDYDFMSVGTRKAEMIPGVNFYIDPGQDVAAGVYRENFDLQYQCSSSTATETQSGVLQIVVNVPSTLTASLAGGSTAGTLDFGDFSSLTRTAMVGVYSTGPYAISFSSANARAMKLQNPPPGAVNSSNAQIPYVVSFAGAALSGGTTHFPRTGVGGTSLPLTVTVDPALDKRAGVYHDVITVTFTPLTAL
jgi:hypothetical protein